MPRRLLVRSGTRHACGFVCAHDYDTFSCVEQEPTNLQGFRVHGLGFRVIYIYIYMCIYIYAHVCIYVYIEICLNKYVCVCIGSWGAETKTTQDPMHTQGAACARYGGYLKVHSWIVLCTSKAAHSTTILSDVGYK